MSAGEVEQMVAAVNKNRLEDMRQEASLIWKLGDLVAIGFNEPKKYPTLHNAFPGLFKAEDTKKQTSWQIMKARVANYAANKNARMLKAGEKE